MRGKSRALRRAVVCAVSAMVMLTGCGTTPAGGDGSPSSPSADGGGGPPERPTELPTDLRECPPDEKDVVDVRVPVSVRPRYDVPAGFRTEDAGLAQIATAEGEDYEATYHLYEQRDAVEVLAVVHYLHLAGGPVADECRRLDVDEVLERLADHDVRSGSRVTLGPDLDEVAGAPALVEERTYPEVGITVRHYWIYGTGDMLNIQCQWTGHRAEVLAGCDALLASLTLG